MPDSPVGIRRVIRLPLAPGASVDGRLIVGPSDLSLTIFPVEDQWWEWKQRSLWWDLSEALPAPARVHAGVVDLVSRVACEERMSESLAESLTALTFAEITRLLPLARAERELRLCGLPPPAPVSWCKLDERDCVRGTLHLEEGSIHISLAIQRRLEARLKSTRATVTDAGVRRERVNQSWSTLVPGDGIMADLTVEFLEAWGWPQELARAIGRAIAIKARAEWIGRQPMRDRKDAECVKYLRAHYPRA